MPTRTISNTGGNYNAVGTWVEGIVPTSADDVVSTATSGQLTVNVASAAASVNLSNYTNTLTMNNTLTISGITLPTTFGASMSFAGTNVIILSAGGTVATPMIINQNTTNRIPHLRLTTANSVKRFDTQIYCVNFDTASPQQAVFANGNNINVSGNVGAPNLLNLGAVGLQGTSKVIADGSGIIAFYVTSQFEINTTGTYSTTGQGLVLKSGSTFSAVAGNLESNFTTIIAPELAAGFSCHINSSLKIPVFGLLHQAQSAAGSDATINLGQTLNINNIVTISTPRAFTTDTTVRNFIFRGAGLSASAASLVPFWRTTSSTSVASNTYIGPNIRLNSDFTHNIGSLCGIGGLTSSRALISSITASSAATLNLGSKETSQIVNYDFTDINASGGDEIVAIGGTLTRTTNITTNYPSGGGVAGGSFTFVN